LKSSIRTKYYFEGLGAMVMPANPKGSHRNLVEYGTKRRSNKAGQNRGKAPMQPFMIPSRAENNAAYNAEMKQLFEGGEDTTV
jgi:hypothetical protein